MKTIELLRHAKSSWRDPNLKDHQRPLKRRGLRDCARIGEALSPRLRELSRCYCSSATRARQTLDAVLSHAHHQVGCEILSDDALYTFDPHRLLAWLHQRDREERQLMLVGHNPALTQLSQWLCDEVTAVLSHVPTCGYLRLECAIEDWSELDLGSASLVQHVYPRDLRTDRL